MKAYFGCEDKQKFKVLSNVQKKFEIYVDIEKSTLAKRKKMKKPNSLFKKILLYIVTLNKLNKLMQFH